MIQRKQTIYFILSAILMLILLATKMADFSSPNGIYALKYNGIYQVIDNKIAGESIYNTNLLMVFIVAASLISIATIFFYNQRRLQIILSVFNFILQVGTLGLIYFYANVGAMELNGTASYKMVAVFPLIALVLTYMAISSIKKDEELIKSLNRIR